MRPVALLQWASYPDRRRTLLIACGLALLLVCQLYGQLRQQKETKRSPSSFADVDIATASRSLMMAPPQGPKHACVSDDWMVWEEYRECIEGTTAQGAAATFGDYLRKTFGSDAPDAIPPRPWANPPAAGVFIEFRPLERLIRFAIANVMDNLPVAWCIYVVGNAGVRAIVEQHFGAEADVGKIRFIDMQHANVPQNEVSKILSSKALYDQLEGNHWLFFQTDSAICRSQRHLLQSFISKGYGWWGAPWHHGIWGATPDGCGNGGFSLRSRALIDPILAAASGGTSGSEDGWFCGVANGLVRSGKLKAPPAPYYEEMQFSVETRMHTKPFGVHAPWKDFQPSWEFRELVQNCPEIISIMPEPACQKFGQALCAAEVDQSQFVPNETTACDWEAMCSAPVDEQFRVWTESLKYAAGT